MAWPIAKRGEDLEKSFQQMRAQDTMNYIIQEYNKKKSNEKAAKAKKG